MPPQFTQLAADNFNRANENPLANGQWTTFAAFASPLQIVGNVCEAVSPNGFGAAQYTGIVWPNDQWAEIKVTAFVSNSDIAVALRCDSGFSNFIEVDVQPTFSRVVVVKGVAGVQTTLGTFPAASIGDVYRLAIIGTTWYLLKNGVQIGAGAMGAGPVSGSVVVVNSYASVPSDTTFDNFAGGSAMAGPFTTVEWEGLRIKASDNGDGTFSISTHDNAGGTGVADKTIEVQGFRLLAHDNGDGTFSLTTTSSTGAGDLTVEWQGLRFKVHPTGSNLVVDGVSVPTYAVVVNAI